MVVGAGFAGMAAVEELAAAPVEVTLVDCAGFHTFQPLLYQVATGGLNAGDIAYPARGSLQHQANARFHLGRLSGVDWEARAIQVDDEAVPFDYLVLAFGAGTNYFGVEGAAEHSLPIYTIAQARAVRDRTFYALERAAERPGRRSLHLVVVGGGPTGVEMAGTLAELRNGLLPASFPELSVGEVHVVLVEQLDHVLSAFHPRLRDYAASELERRGVELRLGQAVSEVRPESVVLASGEVLEQAVTIWAAGVKVGGPAGQLGLEQAKGGRLAVGPDLRVAGHPEVFAVGDLAGAMVDGEPVPQLAQPAIQGGRHAARQIGRLIEGRPTEGFSYDDKGIMATIGRRAAVVQLPRGLKVQGTAAWWAWLGLHVVLLMGRRNRLSVLGNLAWRYVNWPRSVKVIVGD